MSGATVYIEWIGEFLRQPIAIGELADHMGTRNQFGGFNADFTEALDVLRRNFPGVRFSMPTNDEACVLEVEQ